MRKYVSIIYTIFIFQIASPKNEASSPFLNTAIIKNTEQVHALLIQDGFRHHTIQTTDGISLAALYKKHPNAQYTIIFYPGFAGIKERSAPFAALLKDQPCNLLFMDGRNNPLQLHTLPWFGLKEHCDIIAAIEFINADNNKPIFLHGMCGGAFFGIRALQLLQKKKRLAKSHVNGIILDGAWSSRITITQQAPCGWFTSKMAKLSNIKKQEDQNIVHRLATHLFNGTLLSAHYLFLYPWYIFSEKRTNIEKSIRHLPTPLLFIHAKDDDWAPFKDAQRLAGNAHDATTWWIEKSGHCYAHLKYQQAYTEHMVSFINKHL